jgi:hypothetical protein
LNDLWRIAFFPLKQNPNRSLWRELKIILLMVLTGLDDIDALEFIVISNLLQIEKRDARKRCYQMTLKQYRYLS